MKPILRGIVRFPEDGRTIWEGRWAMSESAFDDVDPNQLHSFRYTCASRVEFNVGDTIAFKGYFEVSSVNKGSKSQFTDKQLDMEVVNNEHDSSSQQHLRTVIGRGSNRFGPFEISGTFDATSHVLEVKRIYGPKVVLGGSSSIPVTVRSGVKQQQDDDPAPMDNKVASSSAQQQPQSPSSPVDMAAASSSSSPVVVSKPINKEEEVPPPVVVVDSSFYADAKSVLKELKARDVNKWFSSPVDAAALGLHDYHGVVKHPMDLGTIQTRMDAKQYVSWESCLADMRLVFFNALMYNPRSSLVYKAASDLNVFLDERVKRLMSKIGLNNNNKALLDASLVSTTGMGKRAHKKKKFFEPGEGGALQTHSSSLVVQAASSQQVQQQQVGSHVKKTPKQSAFRVAQPTASAPSHTSKKAKVTSKPQPSQSVPPMAKRIKLVSSSTTPASSNHRGGASGLFDIPSLVDLSVFAADSVQQTMHHLEDDDKESVVSFAGLDTAHEEDVAFMTPPHSDGEEEDQDDDMIIKQTPLSAIPLGEDYNAFGAVSPTNLGDADDF